MNRDRLEEIALGLTMLVVLIAYIVTQDISLLLFLIVLAAIGSRLE